MKATRRLRDEIAPAARGLAGQARDRVGQRLGDRLGRRLGGRLGGRLGDRLPDGLADRLAPTAAPDAPGNRPRAAYAGVLDGRHLWLAVDATPGTLAVREPDSDQIFPLASDLAEDDPRFRSVRTDLRDLPGRQAARFEVVITAPGGKVHRVWTPPIARGEPIRVPPDEGVQWRVARAEDGTLELVREPAPPGAVLLGVDFEGDVATLRIGGAPQGAALRLVDDATGAELHSAPMTAEGAVAVATLTRADVPEGVGLSASVHAGDLPVRRRANDLARPDHAVLLPQVQQEGEDDQEDAHVFAYVLRWLPDGVLRVRRPQPRKPAARAEEVGQS